MNTLPTALIERIDVISANGAPIYGSDAIAGTINVVMKKDFEGFEIDIASGVADGENDAWGQIAVLALRSSWTQPSS